jgi:hypothetical protein
MIEKDTHEITMQILYNYLVFWAQVIIFGQLALVGCIAGPLFWLDIAKSANGSPGYEAGIPLTIINEVSLPPSKLASMGLFLCWILTLWHPTSVLQGDGVSISCFS